MLDPDEIGCAICGGATRAYARKAAYGGEWLIHRCPACGHGAVVNRPTLERLREVYAEVEHHACGAIRPDRLTRSPDARRLAERVGRFTNRRGRVLDVGSGDGGFSFHLARLGFGPLVLIDLDPRAAPAAEVVPRSEFRQCAFEDLTPADGPFTVIVMSQILEHALDPMGWLHRARRLLEPEGVLAVALPNFGGVYRLLGRRDPMLIPPVHLNFFTPRSLRSALETAGFGSISMSSTSRVRVAGHGRGLSPVRVLAGRSWNLASRVLDPTSRGIILNAYAGPVHGGGAMAPPGFGVS